MRVTVLGAGLVGGPMAIDLASGGGFEILVADIDEAALRRLTDTGLPLDVRVVDLSDPGVVRSLAEQSDLVLNAVPGFMGFATLKQILEAGRDVVDIAFFPEDPFELDALARENEVTAIVDCGVAPGMSNLLVGHLDAQLDRTERVLIYVGGLPQVREWPFEYRAVFSPIDVIEEYTRPARYVENGRLVVREALSDPELLDFEGVGTLEAFNTDGLRTLAATIDAPDMKEKTLRYPGHIEKMAVFKATGLFDTNEIEIGGVRIRPLDFTARLLFPRWKLKPGEGDLTVMQVVVEGEKEGHAVRHQYDLLDRYDRTTDTHSMARTTGYTATAAIRMLAEGLYDRKGISPPEFVGRNPVCVDFMLAGLAERGVVYQSGTELISDRDPGR
ncbi:MAG: saccharopine dehydrogenase NADP-binding domain-containing protein [marine benthic group bacterium]|nr:saccharopine dehydrogenase NADP-binding domain-containing protein [Candidatus Carthagonibacter metallireducens]